MGGLVSGDGGVDGGMVGVQDYRLVDGGVGKLVGCLVGGVVRGLVRGLERWGNWVEDWSALLGRRRCQRFFFVLLPTVLMDSVWRSAKRASHSVWKMRIVGSVDAGCVAGSKRHYIKAILEGVQKALH